MKRAQIPGNHLCGLNMQSRVEDATELGSAPRAHAGFGQLRLDFLPLLARITYVIGMFGLRLDFGNGNTRLISERLS